MRGTDCAKHQSIGREKTGKTLIIKRRVWDIALFTIELQDKKRRQKMIGLCLLYWYYHYNLNFLVILINCELQIKLILYIIYFNFSTNFSTSQRAIKHGFLLARQNFY